MAEISANSAGWWRASSQRPLTAGKHCPWCLATIPKEWSTCGAVCKSVDFAHSRNRGPHTGDGLGRGEWVQGRGGVKRWAPVTEPVWEEFARLADPALSTAANARLLAGHFRMSEETLRRVVNEGRRRELVAR